MSGFTERFRAQALFAWRATGAWPAKCAQLDDELQERLLGETGSLLSLSVAGLGVLFAVLYIFISLLVLLALEFIIVGYALLTSVLWGFGAAVGLGPRAVRRAVAR